MALSEATHTTRIPGQVGVVVVDTNGNDIFNTGLTIKKVDYVGGSNPIYMGTAASGSADADAVWTIIKATYDGSNNVISTASSLGSWTNRASLTYS